MTVKHFFNHKIFIFLSVFIVCHTKSIACETDPTSLSMTAAVSDSVPFKKNQVRSNQLIDPLSILLTGSMVAYGFVATESNGLKEVNQNIQKAVYTNNRPPKTNIDDYLQYAPAAAVFAFKGLGLKGRNNFRDAGILYLLSNVILNAAVIPTKKYTRELRPDLSDYRSFPSGHTAEAFASAEFLRLEYKDTHPWYAVAGYGVATLTGYLRLRNNRHWFSDIVGGAGIGILSTQFAYWLYERFKPKIFRNDKNSTYLFPAFQNGSAGIGMIKRFD